MRQIKITIIGAGSPYSPDFIDELLGACDKLSVGELALYDIDETRLGIMSDFCRRYAAHLGFSLCITHTTDRAQALIGAQYVITQFRVGGNQARVNDEKIPLRHGLIGQETTGIGGFMKALRTIPVALDIAKDMERYCPDAWMVGYTNPSGIVAEAVHRHTSIKVVGLCSGGLFPRDNVRNAIKNPTAQVRYDYFGLNHLNFAYNITIDGRPITQLELQAAIAECTTVDNALLNDLCLIASPYLQYFFHTSQKIAELANSPQSRGEYILDLQEALIASFADPTQCTKPELVKKRGGGGYSEVAVGVITALETNQDAWMIANVPSRGLIPFLAQDAFIETACIVNGSGLHPMALPQIPEMFCGLVHSVKLYESKTIEAAVTRSRRAAEQALLMHPLVGDIDVIRRVLPELLAANAAYVGQYE